MEFKRPLGIELLLKQKRIRSLKVHEFIIYCIVCIACMSDGKTVRIFDTQSIMNGVVSARMMLKMLSGCGIFTSTERRDGTFIMIKHFCFFCILAETKNFITFVPKLLNFSGFYLARFVFVVYLNNTKHTSTNDCLMHATERNVSSILSAPHPPT